MIIYLILLAIVVVFLLGLRKIESNPPYKGQITKWGKRIPGKYVNEGWHFFPLYPLWYGVIPIKAERIAFTVTVEKSRTPDRAESKVPVHLTIRPDPKFLCNYLDSGGEEKVKNQLTGKIQERVREWCISPEGGPSTWVELNQSQLEGTSVLANKIAKNSLAIVPDYAQEVPTWIWLRYYTKPRPIKLLEKEEPWANNNWQKVQMVLTEIENKQGKSGIDKLKEAVEKRREQIDSLRTGSGTISIEDLGIIVERLNIGDVDVLGEVAKQADNEAKEEQERQGEEKELVFVLERIAQCMKDPFYYSKEQALEIVQTERGKVPKSIQENKLSVSPETRDFLEKTLSETAKTVMGMFMKGGKS